jgi:hypothetical protein
MIGVHLFYGHLVPGANLSAVDALDDLKSEVNFAFQNIGGSVDG